MELSGLHRRLLAAVTDRAADDALLGFTDADLREQAQAISSGEPYVLRVTVA